MLWPYPCVGTWYRDVWEWQNAENTLAKWVHFATHICSPWISRLSHGPNLDIDFRLWCSMNEPIEFNGCKSPNYFIAAPKSIFCMNCILFHLDLKHALSTPKHIPQKYQSAYITWFFSRKLEQKNKFFLVFSSKSWYLSLMHWIYITVQSNIVHLKQIYCLPFCEKRIIHYFTARLQLSAAWF
jgi:hypothetical protein